MRLAPPETLLGELLAGPAGIAATATVAAAGAARRTLEARGHRLFDAPGGVALACAATHFDPRRFAAAQRGSFGCDLEVWETLGSTNARAWEAAQTGAPVGTVVLSEVQASGRGRQGRRWECPAHAGLLFSLLLPAALARSPRPQLLPLVLAVGVAEALRRATGLDVRLKWPNDLVLVGGAAPPRKLGGILLEAHAGPTPGVVAGCGLNVQVSPAFFAAQALTGAVSLAMTASPPRREELLAEILAAMEQRYQEWDASQWSRALQAWEDLDALRGRVVAVERGGERCHGTARGITPFGLLLLESADGSQHAFAAGEVHLS